MSFHVKPIMQRAWSYIMLHINKIKNLNNIHSTSIPVAADALGLYPSIPHESDLNAIKEVHDNGERKSIPTEAILKMLEFTIRDNNF